VRGVEFETQSTQYFLRVCFKASKGEAHAFNAWVCFEASRERRVPLMWQYESTCKRQCGIEEARSAKGKHTNFTPLVATTLLFAKTSP